MLACRHQILVDIRAEIPPEKNMWLNVTSMSHQQLADGNRTSICCLI